VKGRRLPVPQSATPNSVELYDLINSLAPGDYFGPVKGYAGDRPCVFFLKPNARDPDAPPRARHWQYVASPPHVFTEETDGTLTITASISDLPFGGGQSDGWHGYLTRGEWKKC
jgi:hypothetical protein